MPSSERDRTTANVANKARDERAREKPRASKASRNDLTSPSKLPQACLASTGKASGSNAACAHLLAGTWQPCHAASQWRARDRRYILHRLVGCDRTVLASHEPGSIEPRAPVDAGARLHRRHSD